MTRLPPVYTLALHLRDAHLPAALIAQCLAVEPEAVGPLLALADAKLAALCAQDAAGGPDGPAAPGSE